MVEGRHPLYKDSPGHGAWNVQEAMTKASASRLLDTLASAGRAARLNFHVSPTKEQEALLDMWEESMHRFTAEKKIDEYMKKKEEVSEAAIMKCKRHGGALRVM
mmetsp:Transcript_5511/g.12208  ORF Transcript_5511/g.12208 Transcript_5511/m.12208 type:complete len:104 (+) Transcript_5511:254-565(+)